MLLLKFGSMSSMYILGVARSHPAWLVADTIRPRFSRKESNTMEGWVQFSWLAFTQIYTAVTKLHHLPLQVRANAAFVRKIASHHSLPMNGGSNACRTSKQCFTWMITPKPPEDS